MCGVKTCATLDKENVRKAFLKIKQHNVNIKNTQLIILRLLVRQIIKDIEFSGKWQSAKHGKLTGY